MFQNNNLEIVQKVKMKLLLNRETAAFYIPFSYLPVHAKNDDPNHPTFATDGTQIIINENFLGTLSSEEAIGVFFHEILHNVLGHTAIDFPEVSHKDIMRLAKEYAVNNIVLECGLTLPKGGKVERSYDGWSTLAIYKDLVDKSEAGEDIMPNGCGCNCCRAPEKNSDDNDQAEMPEPLTTSQVVTKLSEIHNLLKASGKSSELIETIGNLIQVTIQPIGDWVDQIKDTYQKSFEGSVRDLTRPVAQYMPRIFVPRYKSEAIENLFIGFDVSSSLSIKDISKGEKLIRELREEFDIEQITLITYNTSILYRADFGQYDNINLQDLQGSGGTRIDVVFEYLKSRAETPHSLLMITDTECSVTIPAEAVPYPVIWLNTGKHAPFNGYTKPNFGKMVNI